MTLLSYHPALILILILNPSSGYTWRIPWVSRTASCTVPKQLGGAEEVLAAAPTAHWRGTPPLAFPALPTSSLPGGWWWAPPSSPRYQAGLGCSEVAGGQDLGRKHGVVTSVQPGCCGLIKWCHLVVTLSEEGQPLQQQARRTGFGAEHGVDGKTQEWQETQE